MSKTPGFKCVDCGCTEFNSWIIPSSYGRGCGAGSVSVWVCTNCGRIHTKKGKFEEDGIGLIGPGKDGEPIYLKDRAATTDKPKPVKITPELLEKIRKKIRFGLGERLKELLKEEHVTEKEFSILTDGGCPFCRAHHSKRV